MKNFLVCISTALLIGGCSALNWSPTSEEHSSASRSVASVGTQTCGDLISFLMSRRNLYSKTQFDNELQSLGFGHVYHGLKVSSQEKEGSQAHQVLVSKMREYLHDGADTHKLLSNLSEEERKLLWRDVIRPQTYELEEQMLSARAIDGDDIAAFLLEVPRGPQRENAESAVILMKQAEPGIDDAAVVARLQRELGACLIR